jgi:hypothetical protein
MVHKRMCGKGSESKAGRTALCSSENTRSRLSCSHTPIKSQLANFSRPSLTEKPESWALTALLADSFHFSENSDKSTTKLGDLVPPRYHGILV